MRYARILPVLLFLPACQGSGPGSVEPMESVIRDAQGVDHGRAVLREEAGRIVVHIRASGLAPGTHGVHLHAVGQCDGPAFESAGPHFNPTAKKHGVLNPEGPHLGDLSNLTVTGDGRADALDQVLGE